MFQRRVDDDISIELFHVGHARELFLAVDDSRDHLRQWLDWVDDTRQILDSREFLRLSMAGWAEGRMMRCAIRVGSRLCGSVSIENLSGERGEIGYWLSADMNGKGVMTRCVGAMTDLAFQDLELHRLELHAATANTKSWAIPERLDWTFEGVRRDFIKLRGQRLDARLYSRLATD